MINFAGLDWAVLGLFIMALAAVAWFAARRGKDDTQDYFLAGRNAGWLTIGASIFASNIGSEHLVGLAGAGAESGMAMAHWELQSWLILILGWVFASFYWRAQVFTMPEFLERRYSPGTRTLLSVISIVSYVLTKVAVTVYAGGVVLKTVLGIDTLFGIDFFWIAALSLVAFTGLFTVFGGMRAVLFTSVLQTPVLIIGSAVILYVGLGYIGGLEELKAINGENARLFRPASDPDFPWPGVLMGSFIIGFWYWCTDQYIVQRVLSARDLTQARRGTIFAGYLKLLPVFIFLFPGMIAVGLADQGIIELESSDAAFPTLVTTLLPAGLKGLVVGGLIAALMSSLASLFNSTATLFTVDFYEKIRPDRSERHYTHVGRIATIAVVFLGIIWIPVMKSIADVLFEYLQTVQSLIAPAIAAVFLLGVFSNRITPAAGFWSLAIGTLVGGLKLALMVAEDHVGITGFLAAVNGLNWLYFCTLLFVSTIVLAFVISLFTKKAPEDQLQGITYASTTAEQRQTDRASWNHWDVIHSVIIVSIIAAVYIYFW